MSGEAESIELANLINVKKTTFFPELRRKVDENAIKDVSYKAVNDNQELVYTFHKEYALRDATDDTRAGIIDGLPDQKKYMQALAKPNSDEYKQFGAEYGEFNKDFAKGGDMFKRVPSGYEFMQRAFPGLARLIWEKKNAGVKNLGPPVLIVQETDADGNNTGNSQGIDFGVFWSQANKKPVRGFENYRIYLARSLPQKTAWHKIDGLEYKVTMSEYSELAETARKRQAAEERRPVALVPGSPRRPALRPSRLRMAGLGGTGGRRGGTGGSGGGGGGAGGFEDDKDKYYVFDLPRVTDNLYYPILYRFPNFKATPGGQSYAPAKGKLEVFIRGPTKKQLADFLQSTLNYTNVVIQDPDVSDELAALDVGDLDKDDLRKLIREFYAKDSSGWSIRNQPVWFLDTSKALDPSAVDLYYISSLSEGFNAGTPTSLEEAWQKWKAFDASFGTGAGSGTGAGAGGGGNLYDEIRARARAKMLPFTRDTDLPDAQTLVDKAKQYHTEVADILAKILDKFKFDVMLPVADDAFIQFSDQEVPTTFSAYGADLIKVEYDATKLAGIYNSLFPTKNRKQEIKDRDYWFVWGPTETAIFVPQIEGVKSGSMRLKDPFKGNLRPLTAPDLLVLGVDEEEEEEF